MSLKTCSKTKGGCGEKFQPLRPMQEACSFQCALKIGARRKEKQAAKAKTDESRQTRAKREAMKTLPELKREAQREFNRYIRARDRNAGVSCICCGKPLDWNSGRGGSVDCGHYRSTGSADHLRFHEDNAHAQRTVCNRHGAGRAVDYRIGLIHRIGLERVEALETADSTPKKWTRDGLRAIRDLYRARANAIEKQINEWQCELHGETA